jgi:choline dehydrogenase-like flavoprotein
LVVGTGPAATAAIVALVNAGKQVTVLDAGTTLDPARQEVVDRMGGVSPDLWNPNDLDKITNRTPGSAEPIHSKTTFGSAYSFDQRDGALPMEWSNGAGFNYSLAKGGLSNVWGSSMLPYREKDLLNWPIRVNDLEPHYKAVMDFVPCTRSDDFIDSILPSHSNQQNRIRLSKQGSSLLDRLDSNSENLRKKGLFHGRARLAIKASDHHTEHCQYCCLCLSGCPYRLIYSSAHTIDELLKKGSIDYHPHHFVERLETSQGLVTIQGRNLLDKSSFSFTAKRVFIGAGVAPTARIILHSLDCFDRPIPLKDSQYFIYPMLRLAKPVNVETERMHTTTQLFLEIDDPRISDHLVHLQVYGYSTFLHHELNRSFLKWPLRSRIFRKQFLGRLMIAQGFIHSCHSGEIQLTLKKRSDGVVTLLANPKRDMHTFWTVLKTGLKLLSNTLATRTVPLLPGLQYPKPGSGYHSGGTFPMSNNPGPLESDILGSLPSLPGVHVVDASVFPSIAATTITMTAMANAHRIATTVAKLDQP